MLNKSYIVIPRTQTKNKIELYIKSKNVLKLIIIKYLNILCLPHKLFSMQLLFSYIYVLFLNI